MTYKVASSGLDRAVLGVFTNFARVDRNQSWAPSTHLSISDEKASNRSHAVSLLLKVMDFLEGEGVVLGVRKLVADRSHLERILSPARPGTCLRHCRMFSRFRSFRESDPFLSRNKLEMDNVTLSYWLHELASHNVGRYTLTAAVGSWNFMAATLDYPIVPPSLILKRYTESYAVNKYIEVSRVRPYSMKLLCWLN